MLIAVTDWSLAFRLPPGIEAESPSDALSVRGNHAVGSPLFRKEPVFSMPSVSPYLLPILLLVGSNVFMTIAWYGHLRFKEVPLAGVILVSWLIAFVEYCLAVPANRWGSAVYTTAQLKTIQEVITLLVFAASRSSI